MTALVEALRDASKHSGGEAREKPNDLPQVPETLMVFETVREYLDATSSARKSGNSEVAADFLGIAGAWLEATRGTIDSYRDDFGDLSVSHLAEPYNDLASRYDELQKG